MSSTSTGTPTPAPYWNDDFIPSIEALDTDEPQSTGDDGKPKGAGVSRPEPRFKHLPRRSPFRKTVLRNPKVDSFKIFEKVVRQQADQEEAPAAPRGLSPAALGFFNDLSRLRPMMKEESLDKCYEFFMTKLWPNAPFQGRNRLLKQRGTYLMGKVAEAKLADMDNERLPSVARITQIFHDLDSLSSTKWTHLIMGLIKSIISRSGDRADYLSLEAYEKAIARKEELLEDLIDSWIIFHRHRLRANVSDLQTSEEAEFRLPDLNAARLGYYAHHGDLLGALGLVFPNHADQHRQVPAVALATFVLMVDPNHATAKARRKAKPLLSPIARILTAVEVRQPALRGMLDPHPEILLYVLKLWDTVVQRLRGTHRTGPLQELRRDAGIMRGPLGRAEDIDIVGTHARVTDALKLGDVATLEAVWAQYWGGDQQDSKRVEKMREHGNLFDYFVMAFTALKRPQRAVDVWDAMVRINVQPTLKTWTSMIEGCRRSRNSVGLENVWKNLVASGEKLDTKVWAARIVGLMDCGEPEAGLRALNEMLSKSKLSDGVPLTVESINAAIAGLIRLNAMSAAKKVLAWASENDIEPDVVTYNTLLSPMVHHGNAKQVDGLLQVMRQQHVEPDGATFTILLDGLISNIKDASPAQQRQSVEQLFAKMEAVGVRANMETFARMLHLIIRDGKHRHRHTEGAVGAIYEHIRAKGLRPSQHIYTLLIDHYFSLSPPALADVHKLLRERGFTLDGKLDGARLDRIFWERLIKGYAVTGHVDRAFELFEESGNVGLWMTLTTLETLLRCLVREDRMGEARRVVDAARLHRGRAREQAAAHEVSAAAADIFGGVAPERGSEWSRGRYWKHGFWSFAHDCGLLTAQEWRELGTGRAVGAGGEAPEGERGS